MRIGIDFHTVTDFMQGSRTYVYNLTRALIETDPVNEYYLYCTHKNVELPPELNRPNVHKRIVFPSTRIIRLPISFPIILAKDKIDVFHCQYIGPPFMSTPYVVTIHDIIHETNPEFFPGKLRTAMSLTYPFCARRAAKVLTVSEYSKKEIARIYKIPAHKITVTYDAVTDDFHPIDDISEIERVKNKYQIGSEYILSLGRLEPRKNISSLIRAFHLIRNKIPHKLVIAGMKDFMYHDLFDLVQESGLQDDVIFTGKIDQADLPALYSGASVFVYPSFGEGFGIPPLEAMACGAPVIASNTTALPEVVGDAGIQIDPRDVEEISTAMLNVLENDSLREQLKGKGLEQRKKFSWYKTAEQVLACYKAISEV